MIETQIIPRLMVVHNHEGRLMRENAPRDPAVAALLDAARLASLLMQEDEDTALASIEETRAFGASAETIWVRMADPAVDRLSRLLCERLLRDAGRRAGRNAAPQKGFPAPLGDWNVKAASFKALRRDGRDEPSSG